MSDQSIRHFSSETKIAYGKPNLSRRRLCLSLSAAALGSLAFAQSSTRAAIVRADVAGLPPYGNSTLPSGIRSRIVTNINGLAIHVLEAGFESKGRQCVLLLHGFPELAYSWRKVMLPLAAAGYHVIAPDQRGYGRTTGWDDAYDGDLDSFRIPNLVRDALGLTSALGYRSVSAVIGHDYGSLVAAYCAVVRPDVFRSVAMMASPYGGPPALPFDTANAPAPAVTPAPSQVFEELAKLDRPRKHYQQYYQTREANDNMWRAPQGIHDFLRAYFHFKSADWKQNQPFKLAAFTASELAKMPTYYIMDLGKGMAETVAQEMPSAREVDSCKWLTEDELDVYAREFGRTGFQGGLQWYRCVGGKYTAELAMFSGRTIDVPACYIAGKSDWGIYQTPGAFERMQTVACTQWRSTNLVDGGDIGYHRSSRRKSVACFCNFCEDKNFRFGIIRNRVGQRQVRAWSAMPPKVVASYPIATLQERNTMAETVTIDRPPVARAAVSTAIQEARDRQRVGAGAAPRLQPAIHRQARSRRRDPAARQGPPARSEPRCLSEILAGERRQSPRVEADADHVKVRTEMLQLRLMEKWRELVRRADVDALIDGSAGVTLTALFPHAARRVAILRPGQHRAGVCAPSWRRRPITEAK